MPRRLCVFCGSSTGVDPAHRRRAQEVGSLLADRGIGLVYGGGAVGLMGALAGAALEGGGEVIGVIPRSLMARELAHRSVADLRVVETMHERKAVMAELSAGFLVLPGGLGTLDELFEAWTHTALGLQDKTLGLLDADGYWTPLVALVDAGVRAGFVARRHRDLLRVSADPAALVEQLVA